MLCVEGNHHMGGGRAAGNYSVQGRARGEDLLSLPLFLCRGGALLSLLLFSLFVLSLAFISFLLFLSLLLSALFSLIVIGVVAVGGLLLLWVGFRVLCRSLLGLQLFGGGLLGVGLSIGLRHDVEMWSFKFN